MINLLKKNLRTYLIGKKIKRFFYSLITIISPALNTKIRYKKKFKKSINLTNPETLNEKLSYLKLNNYNKNEMVTLCSDKILVREYVRDKGYKDILNSVYFTVDNENEIEWNNLPDSFALKWNFGSGYNVICSNIKNFDKNRAYKNLKKWSKEKPWLWYSELQYKKIKKRIICEKYLEGINGKLPYDYKVYCFNGKAMYILVCCERGENTKHFYYDTNWNIQNIEEDVIKYPLYKVNEPYHLNKMIEVSEVLSKEFPFVRVDFFEVDKKLYFGEMTFTPAAAMDTDLKEADAMLGDLLKV